MARQKFTKLLEMEIADINKSITELSSKIKETTSQIHAGNNQNVRTVRNLRKELARHLTAKKQINAKEDK